MSIVIPREVWQPRYSNGEPGVIIGTSAWEAAGREFWGHHSLTEPPGPDATLAEDCAHIRQIEAIGQSRFRQGISYTFIGMPSGRVFEGHSLDRRGAHTYGRNDRSRAYCFAGNYDVDELPERMQRSAALTLVELGTRFDGGHRDVYATACPGRYAYAALSHINQLADRHVRGEIDLSQEDDMYNEHDRLRDEHAAWRLKSFLDVVSPTHDDPNAPQPREEVQAAIDLNATKWRVHDLLHLNEVGTADRIAGEELPFVAAFKALVADVAEIKAALADRDRGTTT